MAARVTTRTFLDMKARGERITMLTAYDYPTARLCDLAGVDALLIGDSLGMVVQGQGNTLGVTMADAVYHTRMVARAAEHALVIADMPFLSFQLSLDEAVANAGRLLAEGGAQAVKLEGGQEMRETVRRMCRVGIPVLGHIGLTPQSVHALGGWRVQGRTAEAARRLLDDALALEDAGAFGVVLELVPVEVAEAISRRLRIPTIGIGSGPGCDGQVLVLHDLIGLAEGQGPRHARRYAEVGTAIREAAAAYCRDVRQGEYPGPEHATSLGAEATAVVAALGSGDPAPGSTPEGGDPEHGLYGGKA